MHYHFWPFFSHLISSSLTFRGFLSTRLKIIRRICVFSWKNSFSVSDFFNHFWRILINRYHLVFLKQSHGNLWVYWLLFTFLIMCLKHGFIDVLLLIIGCELILVVFCVECFEYIFMFFVYLYTVLITECLNYTRIL